MTGRRGNMYIRKITISDLDIYCKRRVVYGPGVSQMAEEFTCGGHVVFTGKRNRKSASFGISKEEDKISSVYNIAGARYKVGVFNP